MNHLTKAAYPGTMGAAPPTLSVVIPTRNESASLEPLWTALEEALRGIDFEACFVDDSDDDTGARLQALENGHPGRVHALLRLDHERAGGLSTAVVAGLRMARAPYVCVMDADLQHPPATIPRMLDAALVGIDVVVASRYTAGGSQAGLDGRTRRIVSRAATTIARTLFSEARRSSDPLSGFFLCRRLLIDGIEFRPVGFKILLELLVCLPDLRVADVPLDFAERHAGESKAGLGQGLLYLGHLRSLFMDVAGSARIWKFGLVGLSGLLIFLPVLGILSGPFRVPPLLAFLPAFALSLGWNTGLNRVWTFADQRGGGGGGGGGDPPLRYLERAAFSGLVMFACFGALILDGFSAVLGGLLGAMVAMVINGLANHRAVRSSPSPWSRIAIDGGVQTGLQKLAEQIGADRAYVLPAERPGDPAPVPRELLDRVVMLRRPALWTEAPSHRPQRRTNIMVGSTLLLPVVHGGAVLAVIMCERHRRHGFDDAALETATRAAAGLAAALIAARAVGERPSDPVNG